jgi:pimeloyl-ACP methyl ester carboxylesterase
MKTLLSAMLKPMMMLSLMLPALASAKRIEFVNEPYGSHERQVFDLWLPKKNWFKKAPLVIFIHGGGWSVGSKDEFAKHPLAIQRFNRNGFAVAAINYRFLKHAHLQTIMREDIGGFVQFIRFHADHYGIDKSMVFAYGFSAGASASLWLATHPDIANPDSPNPIRRESSRIAAAGHANGQVSYDYQVWFDYFGKENTLRFMKDQVWSRYGLHSLDDLYTDEGIRIRQELNMFGHLTPDDAPLMFYNDLEDDLTRDGNHFIHSPQHARILAAKARSQGLTVETHIRADGEPTISAHMSALQFFESQVDRIKKERKAKKKNDQGLFRKMFPKLSMNYPVPLQILLKNGAHPDKSHHSRHHRGKRGRHQNHITHKGHKVHGAS